jgi:hypothetical protein
MSPLFSRKSCKSFTPLIETILQPYHDVVILKHLSFLGCLSSFYDFDWLWVGWPFLINMNLSDLVCLVFIYNWPFGPIYQHTFVRSDIKQNKEDVCLDKIRTKLTPISSASILEN